MMLLKQLLCVVNSGCSTNTTAMNDATANSALTAQMPMLLLK